MIIPTKDNIRTITDMRERALELLRDVQKREQPTIIFHRNSPEAVLLSVKEYNHLMDLLEDYIDGEMAREFEKRPKKQKSYLTSEEVTKKLKVTV